MKISLSGTGVVIDTVRPPENLEEAVKESFAKFTSGTNPIYCYQDKLYYIDLLRKKLHPGDANETVKELILSNEEWHLDEYGELPDRDEYWSMEFMEQCVEAGEKPLYGEFEDSRGHMDEKTMHTVFRIIKTVMLWE